MPHAKLPRKSTNIDMTAMCDVAFLLLTFFMLATKFKPDEPVVVRTPASISEIPIPDADIMLITVDPKGRIFFSIDNPKNRLTLIDDIDETLKLGLNAQEKTAFRNGASVGVPFEQLKSYLDMAPADQKKMDQTTPGIPVDTTTNATNQLATWITDARSADPKIRICIKADGDASYPNVSKIIQTLGGLKLFRFNLITGLKAVPMGTAAYQDTHPTASK